MRNVRKEMLLLIEEKTNCDTRTSEQIYKEAYKEFKLGKGRIGYYVNIAIENYLINS